MKNNNQTNKTSSQRQLSPNPWDLPIASTPSEDISDNVIHKLPSLSSEKNPLIAPSNPPGTLLLTTGKQSRESSANQLWEEWLRLRKFSTQALSEQLTQMWGLLYWQQHLTGSEI